MERFSLGMKMYARFAHLPTALLSTLWDVPDVRTSSLHIRHCTQKSLYFVVVEDSDPR
jgi:hypothetical protein